MADNTKIMILKNDEKNKCYKKNYIGFKGKYEVSYFIFKFIKSLTYI